MSRLYDKRIAIAVGQQDPGRSLALGDMMRLLSLAPLFDVRSLDWISAPELHPLAAFSPSVRRILDPEVTETDERYDFVLQIGVPPNAIEADETIDMLALFVGDGDVKRATFDLPAVVREAFDLPGVDEPAYASAPSPDIDVGFNVRVPKAWAIKGMPIETWRAIESGLAGRATVSWQPDGDDDLDHYMRWVARCRVLVSIVGLGCHVAMFFGRSLIVLSGPTDFREASDYAHGKVLAPLLPCPVRPCYNPQGVDCDGCMHTIDPEQVVSEVLSLLGPIEPRAEAAH